MPGRALGGRLVLGHARNLRESRQRIKLAQKTDDGSAASTFRHEGGGYAADVFHDTKTLALYKVICSATERCSSKASSGMVQMRSLSAQ